MKAETIIRHPPPDDEGWILLTDLRVSGGRFSIRDSPAERHGITEDDSVDVVLLAGGEANRYDGTQIVSRRRVNVPTKFVNAYGLDQDYVDAYVRVRDDDMEAGE